MSRPNVLFIIADDLGFSDLGCYGAEINTPNLDALANDGLRMLNYHTAAACSPTRSMVLTGTDAHLGGLGCLTEFKEAGPIGQRFQGRKGYEGYMTKDVAPLSEILQDEGYFTALSGKVSNRVNGAEGSGTLVCEPNLVHLVHPREGLTRALPCCPDVQTTTAGSRYWRTIARGCQWVDVQYMLKTDTC